MINEKNDQKDRELIISRTLNAPVDLIWEAWTHPEHIAQWWGPNGFSNTIHTMELKPGGVWDLVMHGPDGTDYKNKSIFTEIIPLRRIAYDHVSGPKFTAIIDFTAMGDQTLIRWQMIFDTAEELQHTIRTFKADQGLQQNVEKLSAYMAGLLPGP